MGLWRNISWSSSLRPVKVWRPLLPDLGTIHSAGTNVTDPRLVVDSPNNGKIFLGRSAQFDIPGECDTGRESARIFALEVWVSGATVPANISFFWERFAVSVVGTVLGACGPLISLHLIGCMRERTTTARSGGAGVGYWHPIKWTPFLALFSRPRLEDVENK